MNFLCQFATSILFGMVLSSLGACAPHVDEKMRAQARIRYDLGVASFNQGEMREALRELLLAVEADPTLAQGHNALGLVFSAMSHPDEATKHYREALRLRPKFSEAHNNLGTLLLDRGDYKGAITEFQAALADILYTTPWLAEGNLGWAHYKNGDPEQARRFLGNAVASNPKFCRGYTWLAAMAVELNQPDQILANAKRFDKYCMSDTKLAPTIPRESIDQMHYYVGLGHMKQGNKRAARESFSQCASQAGDDDAVGFAAKCAASLQQLD